MAVYEEGSLRLTYEEQGSGDPVALIMGLGCPSSLWFNQVPEFARSFRVITFDNLGVGGSGAFEPPHTVESLASAAASLIRGIAAGPAHVVGVSMGGTIAQRLAVDHPDVVNKLALVGTWAKTLPYGRMLLGAWREIAQTGGMDLLVRLNLTQYLTPSCYEEQPGLVDKLRNLFAAGGQSVDSYVGQNLACERHDCLDRLPECTKETLVVVGSRDGQTPVGAAQQIVDQLPRATLKVMSGVGHGLMWQDPEPFNAAVLEFLTGAAVDASSERRAA